MSTSILPTHFFSAFILRLGPTKITDANATVNPEEKKTGDEERREVGLLLPSALAKVEEDRKGVRGRSRVITLWELWIV
jgi:hypothetical protein